MIMQQIRTFECDDKIAKHIELLNNKGYTTEFCCSGHVEDGSLGYVSFDVMASSRIKDKRILPPKDWVFCESNNKMALYPKKSSDLTFAFTDKVTEEYIDQTLDDLYEWIEELPVIKQNMYSIQINIIKENE